MRTTIVPAQITTVQDRVIGNLNVPQLIMLTIPIALSGFIFAALPHRMSLSVYKILLMLFSFALFGSLAWKIRGKLIIDWLVIIFRYNLRPRYYVYNKNTTFLRVNEEKLEVTPKPARAEENPTRKVKPQVLANIPNFAQLLAKRELLLRKNVSFVLTDDKKGDTYVVVK